MSDEIKSKRAIDKLKNTVIPVIAYGGVAGVMTGIVVSLFNIAATYISKYSFVIYQWFYDNPFYIPLMFLGLAALALITALVHSRIPEVRGSGVPQTEGVLRGLLTFRWLRVLISTIALSFISFFSGLSLGAEGPSVQIGATTSAGAAKIMNVRMAWQRYVITGGAGAGLAVAFNAPLTGLVFSLEECHRKFSPMLLLSSSAAIVSGTVVYRAINLAIFGHWEQHALFDLSKLQIELNDFNLYWMLLLLGLVVGALAVLFNIALIKSQKFTDKLGKKFPYWARLLLTFLLTGVVALFPVVRHAAGGGTVLIKDIYATADFVWYVLLGILILKLVLILLAYNSGATGGLFVPMLALGAVIGALMGKLFIKLGMSPNYYPLMVCVGMTTFFGASVRTPLTATVLIVEITGYSTDFLPAVIAIFSAYIVAELLGNKPVYDSMLERHIHMNKGSVQPKVVKLEVDVREGAFIIDRTISDVMWPASCIVRGVIRDGEILIPGADTRMQKGDVLIVQAETKDIDETYNYIKGLITQ